MLVTKNGELVLPSWLYGEVSDSVEDEKAFQAQQRQTLSKALGMISLLQFTHASF